MRADAEKNLAAIIAAASSLLAARGTDVGLDDVAREAGVGVATVYRRFPTKDALVEAVLNEKMTGFADRAAAAAERAATEPWPAFSEYVLFVIEQQATDAAFAQVLNAPVQGSTLFQAQQRRVLRSTIQLVKRAQDAGVVRPDLDHTDLYLVTLATKGVLAAPAVAPASWKRFGALMLEAFRATTEPLPPVPRAWSRRR